MRGGQQTGATKNVNNLKAEQIEESYWDRVSEKLTRVDNRGTRRAGVQESAEEVPGQRQKGRRNDLYDDKEVRKALNERNKARKSALEIGTRVSWQRYREGTKRV